MSTIEKLFVLTRPHWIIRCVDSEMGYIEGTILTETGPLARIRGRLSPVDKEEAVVFAASLGVVRQQDLAAAIRVIAKINACAKYAHLEVSEEGAVLVRSVGMAVMQHPNLSAVVLLMFTAVKSIMTNEWSAVLGALMRPTRACVVSLPGASDRDASKE